MELTDKQIRQLEALRNRQTLYEAAIVRPDGTKALLAYCGRHSRRGLVEALQGKRWDAAWRFMGLPADGEIRYPKKGIHLETTNGCRVEFTGRTRRDVIMERNELSYVAA